MVQVKPGMAPRMGIDDVIVEADGELVTMETLGTGRALARWVGWQGTDDAAIVANTYQQGKTLYVGCLLNRAGLSQVMPLVFQEFDLAATCPIADHPDLELLPERGTWVVTNATHRPVSVAVNGRFRDLAWERDIENILELPAFGFAVLDPIKSE